VIANLVADARIPAASLVAKAWGRGLRMPEEIDVDDWADKYRVIAEGASPESGRWQTRRMPHLHGVMKALSRTDPCTDVTFMGAAQTTGKTDTGINLIGKTAHIDPVPILVVLPNHKLIKKYSKRLNKNFAATPVLRELFKPQSRKDSDSIDLKDFPGGPLYLSSAESATDLKSITVGVVIQSEVDEFPQDLDGQGDPCDMADGRSTMYKDRAKRFKESTPTIESLSRINKLFLAGDQRYRYVPCLDCGHYQKLKWKGLVWPNGKPLLAHYECQACAGHIEEYHKEEIFREGIAEWRPTFPERSDVHKSFQLSALYSPPGLGKSFGDLADEWLKSNGDKRKLKVFVNNRLAECWVDNEEKVDWEKVKARAEPYKLRVVPQRCRLITAGVDVQKNRFEIVVIGWDRDLKKTILDHAVIVADPANPADWGLLQAYLDRPLASELGPAMRVECTVIDGGYLFNEVLKFTRLFKSSRWYCGRGATTRNSPIISKPKKPDHKWNGKVDKYGGEFYAIGTDTIKDSLYSLLQSDEKRDVQDRHYRFSDQLEDEFYKQVCSEVFDPHKQKYERLPGLKAEALDGIVYATAAAYHTNIRIDRMTDADWVAREKLHGLGQQQALFEAAAAADSNEVIAPELPLPAGASQLMRMLDQPYQSSEADL
jgi:phage terminase large subunit GpA-like protein